MARWKGDVQRAVEILELLEAKHKRPWEVTVQRAYLEIRSGEKLTAKLLFVDVVESGYSSSTKDGNHVVLEYSKFMNMRREKKEAEILLEQALEKPPCQ